MRKIQLSKAQITLLVGDVVIILLMTLYGFFSHQMLPTVGTRLWSTFVPWVFAWLLVAPNLGAFNKEKVTQPRQLWRPFWAMILASPIGGFLRALWLSENTTPLFVVIFGGFCALGILAWRAIYWFVRSRRS
jgi:hypothetical protein